MFSTSTVYSGTFNYAPSGGEIIFTAFSRIGVRPTEILSRHMNDAVMELNLLLARLANTQPNLWSVELQALPLTESQATYSLPAEIVMITNAYVRTGTKDSVIFALSQTEYAALADKTTEGSPNQFWFNRTISPEITFYPVPDGNGPYTVYYYMVRQIQDGVATNGYNVEVPYLWLDAVVAGLAHRLSRIYAPQLEQIRKVDADEAWLIAANQNVENVQMTIQPGIGDYYKY